MADEQAPVIQPVRANPCHFSKPWFDSVEVRRIGAQGQEELRMLSCDFCLKLT